MAIISTGHLPELTPEQAMQAFANHFQGKYDIYPTKIRGRDFIVKRSAWAGVSVRVKQEKTKTAFVFTAMMPNLILQAFAGGLVAYLFLRSSWKELEREVADFITACPEFQPPQAAAQTPVSPTEGPSGEPETGETTSEQPTAEQQPKPTPKRKRPRKRKAA